jgi:hypothetical protein
LVFVELFEVAGAEVCVNGAFAQHVPDRYEQGVLAGDDGLRDPLPSAYAVIKRAVVAALGARGCPCDFLKDFSQPSITVSGAHRLTFAGAFMVAI